MKLKLNYFTFLSCRIHLNLTNIGGLTRFMVQMNFRMFELLDLIYLNPWKKIRPTTLTGPKLAGPRAGWA
jgi:hypothetical protein